MSFQSYQDFDTLVHVCLHLYYTCENILNLCLRQEAYEIFYNCFLKVDRRVCETARRILSPAKTNVTL